MNPYIIFSTWAMTKPSESFILEKRRKLLWSLLSVSLPIFILCPLARFSLSTNASLCCHSTSHYQTPLLSHLFILSWEPCLSPYSLCILLSYFLFLPRSLLSPPMVPSGTSWNKQPWDANAMWRVKMNINTRASRIFNWQWNASVVYSVQGYLQYSTN